MRRRVLIAGTALATIVTSARAQSMLGTPAPQPPAASPPAANPQAPKLDDTVGAGYNRLVIARWGDGVLPDAPAFNPDPITAAQAATQFPYDAIIAGLLAPPPAEDGIPRLVAILANPTAPARMVFPGGIDQPAVAGKLQGATVLNLQYLSGRWLTVDGGYQSRRMTDGTLCQISGPAAAAIGATVQGVLAPAAACVTLWSTALLAEGDATPWLTRLATADPADADPSIATRFGWVTEFDPLDPASFPVKRTALGRFPRAGIAATRTPDGRPVIFMTEDDPAGYLFRFIAATAATDGTALDTGTLAAAQITDTGITWITLGADTPTLVGTIGAAQTAGASPFDSPTGLAIATDGTGAIYLACAGNPERTAEQTDLLNPRAGDGNGHIIALHPPNGDPTAASFTGEIAIAAGNPATAPFTQYTAGSGTWFTQPRTLALDTAGQLWIGTDQGGAVSATADGVFIMQTGGAAPYLVNMAYLAPIGAAIGGTAFNPATRAIFTVVRHPGATPTASFDTPATRWPSLQPAMPPQTTLLALVGL